MTNTVVSFGGQPPQSGAKHPNHPDGSQICGTTDGGVSNVAYVQNDAESQRLPDSDDDDHPTTRSKLILEPKSKFDLAAHIRHRVHILTWIGKYDRSTAIADAIAGVTLGLTMIPQAIAYAALAGLPSQYGLYSSFVGSLMYVFFGTIKEVSIGPTSLMALLTLQYTIDRPPEYAIVLAFLAGCVELAMGLLRLGFVVDFISVPVTNAFTSATSLIIIGGQLKNLFGIQYSSKDFADTVYQLVVRLGESSLWDCVLGVACCVFLLAMRQLKDVKVSGQLIKRGLWYLSISRNAIVVLITSMVAYSLLTVPFKLSGKVEPGIPQIGLPPFQFVHNNETITFGRICQDLGSGIFVVPIVAVLANVAIAKAFSTGAKVDATQEMLTLGVCNILGSCFKSMPTCGAFTRSAVSQASGVKTPLAGMYSAVLTILALSLLTPYFYYIPRATLASVLVIAVVFMIDFDMPLVLWRTHKRDFYAWLATLLVCLAIGVELGLIFGIAMNILHLLYMWARPVTTIRVAHINGMPFVLIVPCAGMFFPGIDNLRERVNGATSVAEDIVPVVLDCTRITGLDYTSKMGITGLATDLGRKKQIFLLLRLEPELQRLIDSDNIIFCNTDAKLQDMLATIGSSVDKADGRPIVIESEKL